MRKAIWLHIPDLLWSYILNDKASGNIPAIVELLERGASGGMRGVGPAPLHEGVLMTGCPPDLHGWLTYQTARPDGYGTDAASTIDIKAPTLWEVLDAAGMRSAVLNFPATQFLQLQHGLVVADRFSTISTATYDLWGAPPGSIYPLEDVEECLDLRVHPEDLSVPQLDLFCRSDGRAMGQDKYRKIVAKALAEGMTAHNLITRCLEKNNYDLIAVRYPLLEQLTPHLGLETHEGGHQSLGVAVRLLDSFVARLNEVIASDTVVMMTGGRAESPWWIAAGPGVPTDSLLPPQVRLEDFFAAMLCLFDIDPTEYSAGCVPESFSREVFSGLRSVQLQKSVGCDLPVESARFLGVSRPQKESLFHQRMKKTLQFRSAFALAEYSKASGQLASAIDYYYQALGHIPDDDSAVSALCYVLLSLSRGKEARGVFDGVLSQRSEDAQILILDAEIYLSTKDYVDAETVLCRLDKMPALESAYRKRLESLRRRIPK